MAIHELSPIRGTKLGQALYDLTHRREERRIIQPGETKGEIQAEVFPITDQVSVKGNSLFDANGNPSILLPFSYAVPRLRVNLPDGNDTRSIACGSAAFITPEIAITANHVNAIGVRDNHRSPFQLVPGSRVLDEISKYAKRGCELFLDIPYPDSPETFFTARKSNGGSGISTVSLPVEILGEDPKFDSAILKLKGQPKDLNLPGLPKQKGGTRLPYLRISPDSPKKADLVVKAGHGGGSEPLLISQGEVLIPDISEEHLQRLVTMYEAIKSGGANMLGITGSNELSAENLLAAVSSMSRDDVLEFFSKNRLTTNVAEGGDSGGVLVNRETGEILGTTIVALQPFLNNRIIAGALAGFGFGVRSEKLPVDHLSVYTGTGKILDNLDHTLGRKNLYRLIDGNAEEVQISPKEAILNAGVHRATVEVRQALKRTGLQTQPDVEVHVVYKEDPVKGRDKYKTQRPLDMSDLSKRASRAPKHWAGEENPILQPIPHIESKEIAPFAKRKPKCFIGDFKFPSKPEEILGVTWKYDNEDDPDKVLVKIKARTEKHGVRVSKWIEIDPVEFMAEPKVDDHTKEKLGSYFGKPENIQLAFQLKAAGSKINENRRRKLEASAGQAQLPGVLHVGSEDLLQKESA